MCVLENSISFPEEGKHREKTVNESSPPNVRKGMRIRAALGLAKPPLTLRGIPAQMMVLKNHL